MATIVYTLKEWNDLVEKGEVYETQIRRRLGLFLINIECNDCGAHLWEVNDSEEKEIPIQCLSCNNVSTRKVGRSE